MRHDLAPRDHLDVEDHQAAPELQYAAVAVDPARFRLAHEVDVEVGRHRQSVRPGNTVSGPSLFTLADIGGYVCVLSHAGPDALSVTTNLNINFMRKAEAGPVDGICRILKLGKNLMVFDIDIVAGEDRHLVAHATGTYSIPPKRA